jgi:hypothetical protein
MITWEGFEEQVPSEALKQETKTQRTNGWNEKEDKMEEEEKEVEEEEARREREDYSNSVEE